MKKLLLILTMLITLPLLALQVNASDTYNYDYVVAEDVAYNLETGKLYDLIGSSVTNRMTYVAEAVNEEIILNTQTFHYMLFWDKNNNFLGYRTTTYTTYTNDYKIGPTATAVIPPVGTKTFAFMGLDIDTYLDQDIEGYDTLSYRDMFEDTELIVNGDLPTDNPLGNAIYEYDIDRYIEGYNLTYRDVFGDSLFGTGKTNLVENGDDFSLGWSLGNATGSVTNGVYSFTATALYGRLQQQFSTVLNNSYYINARVKSDSSLVRLVPSGINSAGVSHSGSGNYEILSGIFTNTTGSSAYIQISDFRTTGWTQIDVDYVMVYNLTDIFGAGNEPSIEDFEEMLAYYQGVAEYEPIITYPKYNLNGVEDTDDYVKIFRDYNNRLQNDILSVNVIIENILTNTHTFKMFNVGYIKSATANDVNSNIYLKIDDTSYKVVSSDYIDITDEENLVAVDTTGNLKIRVDKSTYTDVATFLSYLQANDVDLIYQAPIDLLRENLDLYVSDEYIDINYYKDKYYYNPTENIIYNLSDMTDIGDEPTVSEFERYLEFYDHADYYSVDFSSTSLEQILPTYFYDTPAQEDFSIWDRIDNALDNAGAGSETSKILISVAIIIAIVLLLYLVFKASTSIILLVSTIFYIFFAVIGWYPAWLNLLVLLIILFLVFILLKGGGSKGGKEDV